MIPRLDIQFPFRRQCQYWFGKEYEPQQGEYLLNHARSGIVLALRVALPIGGRVGVVAYNCHTVANAVVNAGCVPVFMDVTENLKIDISSIPVDLDAVVVTNLFGIRNDVVAIRKHCPNAVIVVDNAHGYGLPAEGDFTVYSINQGKFPALGEGGLLTVNGDRLAVKGKIDELYKTLPKYGFIAQCKLFVSMLVKAIAYSQCVYWLTMKVKGVRELGGERIREKVVMKKMAPGIRRIYRTALPEIADAIAIQKQNAMNIGRELLEIEDWRLKIDDFLVGENAFMAVVRCEKPDELKKEFARRGVETETHFKHCIYWAKEFGYKEGSCPKAEELTRHLLMIPTYTKI